MAATTDGTTLEIFDESGIFALVDASRYRTFVDADWSLDQLVKHFRAQSKSIAVWYGGDVGGGTMTVLIRDEITDQTGYRESETSIVVTAGVLHLASYDALTMAAQFDDEEIPSASETDLSIPIANGEYTVRIVQMYDPENGDDLAEGEPAFIIELDEGRGESEDAIVWLPED